MNWYSPNSNNKSSFQDYETLSTHGIDDDKTVHLVYGTFYDDNSDNSDNQVFPELPQFS